MPSMGLPSEPVPSCSPPPLGTDQPPPSRCPGGRPCADSEAAHGLTYDDRLRRVAQSAPGFGGMFYKGVTTLNVYMLDFDLAQAKAVRAAIEAEFPDEKILGIRLVQGKYSVTQLLDWYDDLRPALAPVYDGLAGTDMDDGLNRLAGHDNP